jgi:hypothetical protein
METRTFEYKLTGSPEELVQSVAAFARQYNMYFKGDTRTGTFSGGPRILGLNFKFKGTYEVKGKRLLITVAEKPSLVSWEQTQKVLSDFVEKGLRPS